MKHGFTRLLLILYLSIIPFWAAAQSDEPSAFEGATATVNPELQYLIVYAEPDTESVISEALSGGVVVTLTGATEMVQQVLWWEIVPPSDVAGWVPETQADSPTLLREDGTPLNMNSQPDNPPQQSVPSATPHTNSASEDATVAVDILLIYTDPDEASPVAEAVVRDVTIELLTPTESINDDTWAYVRSPSGIEGWVRRTVDEQPSLIGSVPVNNQLTAGTSAIVGGTDVVLIIYAEPNPTAKALEAALSGVELTIIGGPQTVAGTTWWNVRSVSGTEGWVSEALDGQLVLFLPGALVTPTATPSPTAVPSPTPTATATLPLCDGAPPPILSVGMRVAVTPGISNRFRQTPGLDGRVIGRIDAGSELLILGGPECVDRYRWWQVDFAGTTGWTADGQGNDHWLVPVTSVESSTTLLTANALNSRNNVLQIGGQARVYVEDEGLKLRSGPGTDYALIENLPSGTIVTLLDGSVQGGRYSWWLVRSPRGNEGWVVERADGIATLNPM